MSKNDPLDALRVIADHYDQIKGTNPHLTEEQVLKIISDATGQTKPNVRKRLKMIKELEWPVMHYLETGVIGMNRASFLVDVDLTPQERTEVMEKSLNENVSDTSFKDYLTRFVEKKKSANA